MHSFKQKARLIAKVILGREFIVKPEIRVEMQRFGSDYGGWEVAIDGLDENSIVYSFGVGEDASFDIALINQFRLTVHAFDPTPRSIRWVKEQNFPQNFFMHEYGIADSDGMVSFNPPENPEHVSHTILERKLTEKNAIVVPVKTLPTIMKELGHEKIDILKLDIEGAEYSVVKNLVESEIRPNQILVEFHHRFDNIGSDTSKGAIKSLQSIGYRLFSVSGSNEEFCFIMGEK